MIKKFNNYLRKFLEIWTSLINQIKIKNTYFTCCYICLTEYFFNFFAIYRCYLWIPYISKQRIHHKYFFIKSFLLTINFIFFQRFVGEFRILSVQVFLLSRCHLKRETIYLLFVFKHCFYI